MDGRNAFATLVGFGVAGLVLATLAVLVGAGAVVSALRRARPEVVVLVAAAIVAWLCLWGLSLRVIAAAVGAEVSTVDAVLVHAGAEVERSLAAIASFDTVNVIPSLSFALVGLAYYATVATLEGRLRVVAGALLALAVLFPAVGLLAWRYRAAVESRAASLLVPPLRVLGRTVPRVSPPTAVGVEERLAGFVAGFERVATDRRRLVIALCLSAAGWAVQALGLWLALYALGAGVPAYVPLFVVPMGTVASALPTPGGLGGIEAVQVALLSVATTVSPPTVTAAVVIFSVGGFLLTTSLGAAAVAALRTRERGVTLR